MWIHKLEKSDPQDLDSILYHLEFRRKCTIVFLHCNYSTSLVAWRNSNVLSRINEVTLWWPG